MIKIEGVSFTYPDGHKAIDNVNIKIGSNETVGIVGANGAGKSTLLKLLTGIDFPEQGSLEVNGIKVRKDTLREVRKNVGIVFQNPDEQLFMTKVRDDIAFGPRNYGMGEAETQRRTEKALKALEIEHLGERAPHKLSGGEKRSVAIASVLSMEPSVLLLDEPSSFLDPKCRRNLIRILQELELTQIIATHDLDLVLDVCDRVVVLQRGSVFADGKPIEILSQGQLMSECGLETPLTLMSCPILENGCCRYAAEGSGNDERP